jgi:hypothetical protein
MLERQAALAAKFGRIRILRSASWTKHIDPLQNSDRARKLVQVVIPHLNRAKYFRGKVFSREWTQIGIDAPTFSLFHS